MTVVTKEDARAKGDTIYYISCPRCGTSLPQPFNRYGGPQYYEHHCGKDHRPRRARFLVAASGVGYFAYQLGDSQRAEPIFDRLIRYWSSRILQTVPLHDAMERDTLDKVA